MKEKKEKIKPNKRVNKKKVSSKPKKTSKVVNKKKRWLDAIKKKNIKPIVVVDYVFLAALVLSVIFGMQTNGIFFVPFTITLIVTVICMCIILIHAVYNKISKKFRKEKNNYENSINK